MNKMASGRILQVFVLLQVLLLSAGRDAPSEKEGDGELTIYLNEFSLEIYHEIARSVEGNIILSPFSIYTAFAMLGTGAKGMTMQQMLKGFHLDNYGLLMDKMKPMFKYMTERKGDNSFLAIANKIWVDNDVEILKSYQDNLYRHFMVDTLKQPFFENTEAARQNMNKWVATKTDEKIRHLFPVGSITKMTKIILASAIYFKGKWDKPFDINETRPQDFHLDPSTSVQVDYMTREDKFAMLQDNSLGVELLEIPYTGDQFSMIFVKPTSKLVYVEQIADTNIIKYWIMGLRQATPIKRRIYIPKFQIEQSFLGLTEILKNLGVEDLFDPAKADLSGINGKKDLYCSTAVHKSFVKVDEEGTVAAGATGIVVGVTSVTPSFIIDRPFLFYIVDKKYNVIIFSGRMMNPKHSESTILPGNIRTMFNSGFTLFASWVTIIYPILTILFLV